GLGRNDLLLAHTLGVHRGRLGRCRLRFFPDDVVVDAPTALGDAGRLADPAAQVVELGASHVTARRHLELFDLRRVQRERPLDADAEGLLAHGEGLARAGALATQDDALEDLGTFAGTLDHREVDADAVA